MKRVIWYMPSSPSWIPDLPIKKVIKKIKKKFGVEVKIGSLPKEDKYVYMVAVYRKSDNTLLINSNESDNVMTIGLNKIYYLEALDEPMSFVLESRSQHYSKEESEK